MSYHTFKGLDGESYGSFEVFYADDLECHGCGDCECEIEPEGHVLPAGFYWWACFPGCMPDGDPCGPFKTEQDAIDDAQSY